MTAGSHFDYRPGLDALRGVAIALVLWQHSLLPGIPRGASVGVTLFFVLSGYLITGLLLDERARTGRISLPRFYWRRGLRLFPALAPLLIFLGILGFDLAPTAFYYADLAMAAGEDLGPLGHTWSLSVEEQYYLIWPVTLLGLVALPRRWAIALLVVVAGAAALWRVVLWPAADRVFWAPDTRGDAILVGCALALLPQLPKVRRSVLALGVGLLLLPAAVESRAFLANIGLPMAMLGSAILVAAAAGSYRPQWSPLIRLGVISYGVYLWSGPLLWWGRTEFGTVAAPMTIALSVLLAAISYRYWERPFLRLKSKAPSLRVIAPRLRRAGPT